jgi:Ca2+-binding RTX toxin-like protein
VSDGTTTTPNTASLAVDPVNDAPTVSLTNVVTSTPENGGVIKVADIVVTDIDGGTNELSLSGTDVGSFTIVGTELHFNGGANFEVKDSYDVTVEVNDEDVGGDTASLTLAISDVVETVPASLPTTSTATNDPNDFDTATGTATTSLNGGGNSNGTGGDDVIVGTGSANNLLGGNGNDTIYGGGLGDNIQGQANNDSLYGQAGADVISGDTGVDVVYGGSGADTLNGNDGNDSIFGGSGNDSIDGGSGMDTIVGGYGADTILPGTGDNVADVLRYLSVLDTNDSITGFVSGTDKVDLSAIDSGDGDAAFNWGGQEAGPVVEANSVTWYTTGGNVVLLADTDGNLNTAEFSITLVGITSIVDSDVIL